MSLSPTAFKSTQLEIDLSLEKRLGHDSVIAAIFLSIYRKLFFKNIHENITN